MFASMFGPYLRPVEDDKTKAAEAKPVTQQAPGPQTFTLKGGQLIPDPPVPQIQNIIPAATQTTVTAQPAGVALPTQTEAVQETVPAEQAETVVTQEATEAQNEADVQSEPQAQAGADNRNLVVALLLMMMNGFKL